MTDDTSHAPADGGDEHANAAADARAGTASTGDGTGDTGRAAGGAPPPGPRGQGVPVAEGVPAG